MPIHCDYLEKHFQLWDTATTTRNRGVPQLNRLLENFPFLLLIIIFASKIRKITKINSKFFKIDFRPAGQIYWNHVLRACQPVLESSTHIRGIHYADKLS